MTQPLSRLPGGLVPALRTALRDLARRQATAGQSLARFLPHLARRYPSQWDTLLRQGLEQLRAEAPQQAALLEARFWQGRTVQALAYQMHVAPSTLYARQRAALERLALWLWQQEQRAGQEEQQALAHKTRHLPAATYSQLFGLDAPLARLQTWLLADDGPRWALIEGLGGLGKTTLAHAFAHRHLTLWDDLAWVDAHAHRRTWENVGPPLDAETLLERVAWQLAGPELAARPPASRRQGLRALLSRQRILVVLDDLLPATLRDILAWVPPPPAPSRFLLITRYRPTIPGPHLPLRELSREDSLALLQAEIAQRGLPSLTTEALNALYEAVGGNPLALKLTVGHLAFLPLQRVLVRLQSRQSRLGEDLFASIYEPLVTHLPGDARRVLEAMPFFAPQGATYDELRQFTELPPHRLDEALYRLMYHALLDLDPRPPARYFIHRLTYVYLTRQVEQAVSSVG